ncbi:MAG: HNH endonuclease signature motif containing protein [Acidobacteriota bacterium]
MSGYISASLRDRVTERAGGRCEYCGLAQLGQEATFHVDHALPAVAGGPTTLENLALACVSCSLHKAARQTAVDSESGEEAPLFNPRIEHWADHFQWRGFVLVGTSATGRATIDALRMNRPLILAIREEEKLLGRHPPPGPGPKGLRPL